ncbi:winged helix-turn-helix domain-containing protein [Halorussus salinus]|uniref:winged helix-turn-helix domain-containing protein n=1 Tax=Halorussus salinus TaxID=1364935 RepID=UPI00138EEEBF|nr:helix-turn-helix domain-containing protein [Halorussus salinus]
MGAKLHDMTDDLHEGENAFREFFVASDLVRDSGRARVYTDVLLNQPTTVSELDSRLEMSPSSASKFVTELEETGLVENVSDSGRKKQLTTDPVIFTVTTGADEQFTVTPTVIAAAGARAVDEDIDTFIDRNGYTKLGAAVAGTVAYLNGDLTRRGVARELDLPEVEAITITIALEGIVGLLGDADPVLTASDIDVHGLDTTDAAYVREASETDE